MVTPTAMAITPMKWKTMPHSCSHPSPLEKDTLVSYRLKIDLKLAINLSSQWTSEVKNQNEYSSTIIS